MNACCVVVRITFTYQNVVTKPWQEPELDDAYEASVPEHDGEEHNAKDQHATVADSDAKAILRLVV